MNYNNNKLLLSDQIIVFVLWMCMRGAFVRRSKSFHHTGSFTISRKVLVRATIAQAGLEAGWLWKIQWQWMNKHSMELLLFFSCPPRTFLPALCKIFLDEYAPDNVLEVTARAITYYLDVSGLLQLCSYWFNKKKYQLLDIQCWT